RRASSRVSRLAMATTEYTADAPNDSPSTIANSTRIARGDGPSPVNALVPGARITTPCYADEQARPGSQSVSERRIVAAVLSQRTITHLHTNIWPVLLPL